jgi:AAA ATPase-like protein
VSDPGGIWLGRARELERLEAIVGHALAGRGGSALIVGDAGMGKTRLLERVAERARERGLVCAWGRGWELGEAPSFWPWQEMLQALFERPLAPDTQRRRVETLLAAARGATAGSLDTFASFDAVLAYLQAHARIEPLLLLLDDLHAFDPSSLALLEFAMQRLRASRLVLLGSQRTPEDPTPELQLRLLRLSQSSERLELPALTEQEVSAWVARATGSTDLALARRVHEASDGNPLFVRELLHLPALAAGGERVELPPSLRALLLDRLRAQGGEQREWLAAGALIGREFSVPLLADVTMVASAALESACHEAARAGVLEPLAPGRYRFCHALVAETLLLELEPARRAGLHRRAAEALERRHVGDLAAPLAEIARHWLSAGVDAAPRALDAAERAARQASLQLAFSDAAQLYERALGALGLCSPLDTRRQGELLVARVEALSRAGLRERAELACAQATELARARGDAVLLATAALALGAESRLGKADATVARLLERALAGLPDGDGELQALVAARLASARQPEVDPEGPMALARDAIAMARRIGSERSSLRVIHAALGALMDFAPAEERAALNAETLELATRLGDFPRALVAAQRLAFDRIELADVAGFESALERYEALSAEAPQPRYAWVPAMFRAMRADWHGERERAEHWEQHARQKREQGNGEGAALVPARPLARALLHADVALLERFVAEVEGRSPDSSGALWLSALLGVWRGDRGLARSKLDRLAARGLAHLVGRSERDASASDTPMDTLSDSGADGRASSRVLAEPSHGVGLGYLLMPEIAVELACHLQDVVWARALYRELSPSGGKPFLLTTVGFTLHGSVDHALMRLCLVEGNTEAAARHAARARELCLRLRAQPLLARLEHDAGQLAPSSAPQPAAIGAARGQTALDAGLRLSLEGDVWTVSLGDALCRVQDNRGMHMLARLVEQPGRELHVLDLSGSPSGVDTSDAGEVLDARARSAYEARLRELPRDLAEATSDGDLARRARLEEESDALLRELSRGFGLGGRPRRSASAVERARVNVRRRLTLALRRIRAANPALAAELEASLRTGVFCVYAPRERS